MARAWLAAGCAAWFLQLACVSRLFQKLAPDSYMVRCSAAPKRAPLILARLHALWRTRQASRLVRL